MDTSRPAKTHPDTQAPGVGAIGLAAVLLACIIAAGCNRASPPAAPQAAPATAPATAGPTASVGPPPAFPALPPEAPLAALAVLGTPTAAIVSMPSSRAGPGNAVLRAVRTGRHANADRIAFEFEGTGIPAFKIEYIDRPVRDCRTGEPLQLAGDGWLEIAFTGAQAYANAGKGTSGPRRRRLDQPQLLELVRTCDSEGHLAWVAGVSTPNRYTPSVATDPARLVIDIVD